MPRNGNSSRKRPAESEEEEEEEPVVGGSDEEMEEASESGEEESGDDEEMEEKPESPMGSPSPMKKGIQLRSGRRKRRRSKETTGLTPPEELKQSSKRARPTTERKTKGQVETPAAVNGEGRTAKSTGAAKPSVRPPRASTRGRQSLLSSEPEAVARAQDPEVVGSPLAPPDVDSSRRLFDGKPISELPVAAAAPTEEGESPTVTAAAPAHSEPQAPLEEAQPPLSTTNGYDSIKEKLLPSPLLSTSRFWKILFMVLLTWPLHMILWPVCVGVSDYLIPLREFTLPDSIPVANENIIGEGETGIEQEGEEGPTMLEPPSSVAQSMETMSRLQSRASQKLETIQRSRQILSEAVEELSVLLNEKQAILEGSTLLKRAETLLVAAVQENDLDRAVWKQARQSAAGVGRTILDTPSIELWQVDAPEGCPEQSSAVAGGSSSVNTSTLNNPAVSPQEFEKMLSELAERATSSANSLKDSPAAQELVRTWSKEQIDKALEGDELAAATIANLAQAANEPQSDSSGDEEEQMQGLDTADIEEIIEERLEMELADRTGEFDHASIYNGARILREGKWATSNSLVDSLPLGNRLLQLWQLQFYGFGPEAAITPTYPVDALGQCWSFRETPVSELLKRGRSQSDSGGDDDHKNGNFGTLTISLPSLVRVRSVVIEHPPRGLTDQIGSAIRYFRVIGFEGADATSRSWSLGSFEYDPSKYSTSREAFLKAFHNIVFVSSHIISLTTALFQNLQTLFKNLKSPQS
jgi:hypothetical protein